MERFTLELDTAHVRREDGYVEIPVEWVITDHEAPWPDGSGKGLPVAWFPAEQEDAVRAHLDQLTAGG